VGHPTEPGAGRPRKTKGNLSTFSGLCGKDTMRTHEFNHFLVFKPLTQDYLTSIIILHIIPHWNAIEADMALCGNLLDLPVT
jgi:hypothetical protein